MSTLFLAPLASLAALTGPLAPTDDTAVEGAPHDHSPATVAGPTPSTSSSGPLRVAVDGERLAGVLVVESFIVPAGCTVFATDDLAVLASGPISIEGTLLGTERAHAADGRGASILLRSRHSLEVSGAVLAGDGCAIPASLDGGAGGDLWLEAPRITHDGFAFAGTGFAGTPTATVNAVGGSGGDGGDLFALGPIRSSAQSAPHVPQLCAGDGGHGGRGEAGGPTGPTLFRWSAAAGGDGGDGGQVGVGSSCADLIGRGIDPREDFAFDRSGPLAQLILATCDGYTGLDGDSATSISIPINLFLPPPTADDCSFGADGDGGANASAGKGGDGGRGGDATCFGGNGGRGGVGGDGGSALNSATAAERGQDAGDCCDGDEGGPGAGQYGGRGGPGGDASSGGGGRGGDGGLADPGPWFGLTDGEGGRGGNAGRARAQSGGEGGFGGDGTSPGYRGQGGIAGASTIGAPGAGGLAAGGTGIQAPSGNQPDPEPGDAGADGQNGQVCPTEIG